LPLETLNAIAMFYQDDEHSRQLPGKKDFVSLSRNGHQQKQLLHCNLKELYSAFKLKNPLLKVGFSKFCSLRESGASLLLLLTLCVSALHVRI